MYMFVIHFLFFYSICGSQNNHSLVTATALTYAIIQRYLTGSKLQIFRVGIDCCFSSALL